MTVTAAFTACSTFSHFRPRLSWTGLLTWWHIPAFNPVWSELLVVLSLWHHDKFLLNKTAGQKSTKDVPASILWFSKEFSMPSWCSNNLNSLVIKISHLFFAACDTLIFCSLSSSAPPLSYPRVKLRQGTRGNRAYPLHCKENHPMGVSQVPP